MAAGPEPYGLDLNEDTYFQPVKDVKSHQGQVGSCVAVVVKLVRQLVVFGGSIGHWSVTAAAANWSLRWLKRWTCDREDGTAAMQEETAE